MQALYTAEATATGGREGRVRSSDGALSLEPRRAEGARWTGRSAEQPRAAFAAGFAACFERRAGCRSAPQDANW